MHTGLALSILIAALVAAAWCAVAAARGRWIDVSHLIALSVVELALVVQAILAVVRLVAGDHPVEYATFIGYLVFSVVTLPVTVAVAFMERTRWGSVIAAGGAAVVAVVMLRLQQVWTPLR